MKVNSISISHYYGNPTGSIVISSDETQVSIKLTPQEVYSLMTLGLSIFRDRQKDIGHSITNMSVPLLSAPTQEAKFEEVPATPVADEVPF